MKTHDINASKRRDADRPDRRSQSGASTLWSNVAQVKRQGRPLHPAGCDRRRASTRSRAPRRRRYRRRSERPLVVENQPGAGGIVGTSAMIKSPPDGTTLSIVSNNHRHLSERLQVAAVRSAQRHHADRDHRLDADRFRRQSEGAREGREGADRAAEGEARRDTTTAHRATARSCIWRPRCSWTRRASRRRTCRTRASGRC